MRLLIVLIAASFLGYFTRAYQADSATFDTFCRLIVTDSYSERGDEQSMMNEMAVTLWWWRAVLVISTVVLAMAVGWDSH